MLSDLRTRNFLGLELVDATYQQVLAKLDQLSREDQLSLIVTPNVDHVVMLDEEKQRRKGARFARAYQAATLRLCDSRVLQAFAFLRGAFEMQCFVQCGNAIGR